MQEKTCALTLLDQGMSVMRVAAHLQVIRMTMYSLKKAAAALPPGTALPRVPGSGTTKKTSTRTDKILRREVTSDPSIIVDGLKKKTSYSP